MENKFSASILSADLCNLQRDVEKTGIAGADMIHFDVMDGVFVDNISYGIPVLKCLRKVTDLILDVHLMITEPHRYIKQFAESGADIITFHYEAESDIKGTIELIKSLGKKAGLSVKPGTDISEVFQYFNDIDMLLIMTVEPGFGGQGFIYETLDKIKIARDYAEKNNIQLDIEVDGGINAETSNLVKENGANVLVAGSYFFKSLDYSKTVAELKG